MLAKDSIACDGCGLWYDIKCQKLTLKQLDVLSLDHVPYCCTKCEKDYIKYGGIAMMLSSLAHVGFKRLNTFSSKIKSELKCTDILSSKCEYNNAKTDPEASSIQKETHIHKDKVPLHSTRDGNCLFNSSSLALCGNESLISDIKSTCCLELLHNENFYSKKGQDMFNATGVTYQEACVDAAKEGAW